MLHDLEISYNGDLIERVQFQKGLSQRPLWETLRNLEPDQMVMWVDRFDSLCAVASEWALVQALEESAGVKMTLRTQIVRSTFAELNRLIYLTTYLANVVRGLGLMQSFQQMMILREQVFQKQEEITGGRILPQIFRIGGVRRDLALGDIRKIKDFLKAWKSDWDVWMKFIVQDTLLENRLENLLVLPGKECRKYGMWGIIGKASRVGYDSRIHQPHGAYATTGFNLNFNFNLNGDALSRFRVAVFEVELSLRLCEEFLNQISTDAKTEKSEISLNQGIFTGSAESAKGPVTAVVEVNGHHHVQNVKLFTVGSRVWPHIEDYFVNQRSEEFDLLWASLGMSGEESEI